jgi:methionyl-tRNA formyltransferase
LNGERETGVSIFKLDEGLDTGPIFAQSKYEIPRMATTKLVLQELARLSIEPLVSTISAISKGDKGKAQSEFGDQMSMAPKINKSDGHLRFDQPISNIRNRFLALCDNPGVYATVTGTRIKFENLDFEQVLVGNSEIGEIQNKKSQMQIVATDGIVTVKQLRPEGKSSMTGAEFLRGRPNLIGQIVN